MCVQDKEAQFSLTAMIKKLTADVRESLDTEGKIAAK